MNNLSIDYEKAIDANSKLEIEDYLLQEMGAKEGSEIIILEYNPADDILPEWVDVTFELVTYENASSIEEATHFHPDHEGEIEYYYKQVISDPVTLEVCVPCLRYDDDDDFDDYVDPALLLDEDALMIEYLNSQY